MRGLEMYAVLKRYRPYTRIRILVKVYNDWIRTEAHLVGFLAEVEGILQVIDGAVQQKDFFFKRLQEIIDNNKLPLEIEDIAGHKTQFKLRIIKEESVK